MKINYMTAALIATVGALFIATILIVCFYIQPIEISKEYESIADFNNDGIGDTLIIAMRSKSSYYRISVALGMEEDTFQKSTQVARIPREKLKDFDNIAIQCGDYDSDENIDFAIGDLETYAEGFIKSVDAAYLFLGNGDGTFREK